MFYWSNLKNIYYYLHGFWKQNSKYSFGEFKKIIDMIYIYYYRGITILMDSIDGVDVKFHICI